jgi:hypothetical protein
MNKCSQNIRKIQLMNIDKEINNLYNSKDKNINNIYLFRKINHKIVATKKDYPSNRQKTEREKIKNYLLNIPTRSHTIDHASKSSSKGKRIYKSPNLTRFNTRKYLKNNPSNINTIENQKPISITYYNNKAAPNFFLKKKFNIYSRLLNKRSLNNHNLNKSGNKNGNLNNFRMQIYNKSLDNGYRKDRYRGINNYYNFRKFNNIKEIKKKVYRTIETKRRTDSQNSYSPIITREMNEQKNKDSYLLLRLNNAYSEINKNKTNKNIMKLKKKKEEKKNSGNSNRMKININNYNQNYYNINKINNAKKIYNNLRIKNNNNISIEDTNGINRAKNRNKILFSLSLQKDKKDNKKAKTKKSSSFSIDLNFKNTQKIEYNIYTNRPRRKNVMKFVNKNIMNIKI